MQTMVVPRLELAAQYRPVRIRQNVGVAR